VLCCHPSGFLPKVGLIGGRAGFLRGLLPSSIAQIVAPEAALGPGAMGSSLDRFK